MNTEIKDEGELSPEEMQEKSDEAREAMVELDEAREPSLVDNLMNLVMENRKQTLHPVFHPEWLVK